MTRSTVVFTVLVLAACKGERAADKAPEVAVVAKPMPVAPSTPGLPDTIRLVPDGTLVNWIQKGQGGTWNYAYAGFEPVALAAQQRAVLDAAGWKTVLREEAPGDLPRPVYSVFGNLGDRLAIAQIYRDASGATQLRLILESMQGLRMDPPDGYPPGFPFLAFGIPYTPASAPTTNRITLVYNGELQALIAELTAATQAAGWDCHGASFTQLSGCSKDGREVFVMFDPMSSNRQGLHISQL